VIKQKTFLGIKEIFEAFLLARKERGIWLYEEVSFSTFL